MSNYTTTRNRSYNFRPLPFDFVETLADDYFSGPIPAGTRIQVRSVSNAGFRGIELNGYIMGGDRDGDYVVGISTGNAKSA